VPDQPRLRKREILLAVGAGVLASGAALAILDNDGDDGSRIARSEPSEMTYQLANSERISTTGPQEAEVTFGDTFAVHAEGAIGQLEVVVEDGELVIRPRNGGDWDWGDFDSTKINVTMPRLTRVSLSGTGDIAIDQIKGERFSGVIAGGFDGNIRI